MQDATEHTIPLSRSQPRQEVSRRRLLIGGSVIAGAAWVAPSVTTSAAAAIGTCAELSVLDWDTYYNPGDTPVSTIVDGVTVTQTFSSTGTAPGANSNTIMGNTSGNRTPYLRLEWSSAAAFSTQTLVFSFSQTVFDVCFTLTDIDASTGSWEDIVDVSATGPGTPVIGSTFAGPNVLGSNPWSGDPALGNVSSTSTNGNVDVTISGSVDTFTVLYTAGSVPPPAASQHVGIYNPSWCD